MSDALKQLAVDWAEGGVRGALVRAAIRHVNRNDEAVRERWQAEERDRQIRVLHGQARHLEALQSQVDDQAAFLSKVDAMLTDHQYWRIHENLGYEAARSVLDSRKEMLEAAGIGLCDPTMSIEDKARVERTLRELDPADVALLKRLADLEPQEVTPEDRFDGTPGLLHRVDDATAEKKALSRRRGELANEVPMSRGALLATGCINTGGVAGPFLVAESWEITHLGHAVLRALSSYPENQDTNP